MASLGPWSFGLEYLVHPTTTHALANYIFNVTLLGQDYVVASHYTLKRYAHLLRWLTGTTHPRNSTEECLFALRRLEL
jgi:hypothetical protein